MSGSLAPISLAKQKSEARIPQVGLDAACTNNTRKVASFIVTLLGILTLIGSVLPHSQHFFNGYKFSIGLPSGIIGIAAGIALIVWPNIKNEPPNVIEKMEIINEDTYYLRVTLINDREIDFSILIPEKRSKDTLPGRAIFPANKFFFSFDTDQRTLEFVSISQYISGSLLTLFDFNDVIRKYLKKEIGYNGTVRDPAPEIQSS